MREGPATETRTTCPYCGVGCGVLARVAADGAVAVRGDPDHPANEGRLCSKGTALAETLALGHRLLSPEIDGRPAGWDAALDRVAERFGRTVAEHGPDSVAFYVSGQLLTEDYYVANKLMKGFIGSANIDTNSRLCMASSVAGHKRAFGEDVVPGIYADFDMAELIVLAGSNAAWCHPVLHQRMRAARDRGQARIVVIDPRATASTDDCDLHLQIRPGTDVALFNGLLAHLDHAGAIDRAFVAAHTQGLDAALATAQADAPAIESVARICDVPAADLARFFAWFAATAKTVTVYSQGINQSAQGTDKVNAILNCHIATGRVGRPGASPFSVTGQPNAMGGREVGGLANQLAAHVGFEDAAAVDAVAAFWQAPSIARSAGLKAVDLFEAVGDGRVKALWIMGTNPAASMPDAGRVRRALRACAFLAVSDVTRTDTTAFADVVLPAAAWGEKDGTVTNSDRLVSRQRRFLPPPGGARPDWWIVTEVARRMGFAAAFPYTAPDAIFREHAALSAHGNHGARLFDLGGLSGLPGAAYDRLGPRRWPLRADSNVAGEADASAGRLLGDGRFPTPDGKARLVAVRQSEPALPADAGFPILLNTGRLRDQWHTMTRTGHVPRLMAHAPEPTLDLAPADAAALGLGHGALVRIESRFGTARARLRTSAAQRPGEAFLPMHWSGRFAGQAAAGLVASPLRDPISGQPELKRVRVRIAAEPVGWEGLLATRRDLKPTGFAWWNRQKVAGGWLYSLAGPEPADQGMLLMQGLAERRPAGGTLDYADRKGRSLRRAVLDADGALAEALLVAAPGRLPDARWLLALLASAEPLSPADRRALLSARAPVALPDAGRLVCSCFGVGERQIADAAAAGCVSVAAIGQVLGAGTNCGSCRGEIREIVDAHRLQAAE